MITLKNKEDFIEIVGFKLLYKYNGRGFRRTHHIDVSHLKGKQIGVNYNDVVITYKLITNPEKSGMNEGVESE